MADVTISWLGKKITIIDNGDNKLGTGDKLKIGYSSAVSLDSAEADELRTAGLDLASLRGARLSELSLFFSAIDRIREGARLGRGCDVAEAKRLADEAGISSNPAAIERILDAVLVNEFDSFTRMIVLSIPEAAIERLGDLQKFAASAGLDFTTGPINPVTFHYVISVTSMKMAAKAEDYSVAVRLVAQAREHAQKAGIAFDAEKAAEILGSFIPRECGSPSEKRSSRLMDPVEVLFVGAARCYHKISPSQGTTVELKLTVGLMR
ncbi:MAG: hypothetical protein WC956_01430 [bacterium]